MNTSEKKFLNKVKQGRYIVDIHSGRVYSGLHKRFIGSNHTSGYVSIGGGGGRTLLVHRLVWICAGNDIPDGYEVNHKDGNKKNNSISNLECVTRSVNTLHARHVLGKVFGIFDRNNSKENNGRSVLTQAKVNKMRALWKTGKYTKIKLANMFGIGKSQASNIVLGKSWK